MTNLQQEVIDIMNSIEYGKIVTYNDILKIIAKKKKLEKMSSQAVGGAVGWNPICIIIPCHRVVGTNGSLTGYALVSACRAEVVHYMKENNLKGSYILTGMSKA